MLARTLSLPDAAAITPSDTADNTFSFITVSGSGDVKVTTEAGTAVTFANVPAGFRLRIRTQRVWSTGTTATGLVGHRPGRAPHLTSGLPALPEGYVFLVDSDGNYLVDSDGAYFIGAA
jgi:hypothetical protein